MHAGWCIWEEGVEEWWVPVACLCGVSEINVGCLFTVNVHHVHVQCMHNEAAVKACCVNVKYICEESLL